MKKLLSILVLAVTITHFSYSQNSMVTYAGGSGLDCFYEVVQLSDGTFLVAGYTDDLSWLSAVSRTELAQTAGIPNANGTNRYGIILQYSEDFQTLMQVVHLPQGVAEDIMFIKTTNRPGQPTGELFVSGTTQDTKENNGGYFIGKLNNNFVQGTPTSFEWIKPVWADADAYFKGRHGWDVTNNGKVYYLRGETHKFAWSEMARLDRDGNDDVVPGWTLHWKVGGGEFHGVGSDFPGGLDSLSKSAVLFKKDNRCCLRSWTEDDYNLVQSDGNGGFRTGKWPMDQLFAGPCTPGGSINYGRGYGGKWYRVAGSPSSTETYGPSVITVDRRNNDLYFGFNVKTVLPEGNPDFEPAVVAMDSNGVLRWWSRLYHEVRPNGDTMVSEPDQYIDGIAIDYSRSLSEGLVVVNARCHGNNVENFWQGNQIAANPSAYGFSNRFTGASGNIHIGWLGKLKIADGTLMHSTFVAEYSEGTGSLGVPFVDPNMDNWPNPNSGWPNVNTTQVRPLSVKVATDGSVIITSSGRRTITTRNAHQRMVLPANGGKSSWNQFVREYTPDLSRVTYSTLLVGQWDTITETGGNNTDVYNIFRVQDGIVAVGRQRASSGVPDGNPIPVANVPSWGNNLPTNESAILAYFKADSLLMDPVNIAWHDESSGAAIMIYPNPSKGSFFIDIPKNSDASVEIFNIQGCLEYKTDRATNLIQVSGLNPGVKLVLVRSSGQVWRKMILVE